MNSSLDVLGDSRAVVATASDGAWPMRLGASRRAGRVPGELLRIASLQRRRVPRFHTKTPLAFLTKDFDISDEPQVMAKQTLLAGKHLLHRGLEQRMSCHLISNLRHPFIV